MLARRGGLQSGLFEGDRGNVGARTRVVDTPPGNFQASRKRGLEDVELPERPLSSHVSHTLQAIAESCGGQRYGPTRARSPHGGGFHPADGGERRTRARRYALQEPLPSTPDRQCSTTIKTAAANTAAKESVATQAKRICTSAGEGDPAAAPTRCRTEPRGRHGWWRGKD